jgi:hypothetical protein
MLQSENCYFTTFDRLMVTGVVDKLFSQILTEMLMAALRRPSGRFKDRKSPFAGDAEINREFPAALFGEAARPATDRAETGKEALDMIAAAPRKYDAVSIS